MAFISQAISKRSVSEVQNILELPLELLSKILIQYLNQKDILSLRLAHSHFQTLIDDYIGLSVAIDQKDPPGKYSFLSEISIRNILLRAHFIYQDLLDQEDEWRPSHFKDFFLYPEHLQGVKIRGFINPWFLSDLVRHCEIIRHFELILDSSSVIPTNHHEGAKVLPEIDSNPLKPVDRPYLSRVNIMKLLCRENPMDSPFLKLVNTDTILTIARSFQSPLLKEFLMQCSSTKKSTNASITLVAVEVLEAHPCLRSFFFGVEPPLENFPEVEESDHYLTDGTKRAEATQKLIKMGETLRLQKIGLAIQVSDVVLWKNLIVRQNTLVNLSFTVDLEDDTFCAEMFTPSKNTLKQFILRGRYRSVFDFQWLEECKNLKEICLHNLLENEAGQGQAIRAVNLGLVPAGLQSIILFQIVSRTEEIIAAVQKLKKLDTLVLFKMGTHAGETGVDLEAIRLILNSRHLESILIVRLVASTSDEASNLIKLMHTINGKDGVGIPSLPRPGYGNIDRIPDIEDNDDELPPLEEIPRDEREVVPPRAEVAISTSDVNYQAAGKHPEVHEAGGRLDIEPSPTDNENDKDMITDADRLCFENICRKELIKSDDKWWPPSEDDYEINYSDFDPLNSCLGHDHDTDGLNLTSCASPEPPEHEPEQYSPIIPSDTGDALLPKVTKVEDLPPAEATGNGVKDKGTEMSYRVDVGGEDRNNNFLPSAPTSEDDISNRKNDCKVPEKPATCLEQPPECSQYSTPSASGTQSPISTKTSWSLEQYIHDKTEFEDPSRCLEISERIRLHSDEAIDGVDDDGSSIGSDIDTASFEGDDEIDDAEEAAAWAYEDRMEAAADLGNPEQLGVGFEFDLDDEMVLEAANGHFQLILDLENEFELENILGLFDPINQPGNDDNPAPNNIAFGFVLDGVVDITSPDPNKSRWIAFEDDSGHLTYSLKIAVE